MYALTLPHSSRTTPAWAFPIDTWQQCADLDVLHEVPGANVLVHPHLYNAPHQSVRMTSL